MCYEGSSTDRTSALLPTQYLHHKKGRNANAPKVGLRRVRGERPGEDKPPPGRRDALEVEVTRGGEQEEVAAPRRGRRGGVEDDLAVVRAQGDVAHGGAAEAPVGPKGSGGVDGDVAAVPVRPGGGVESALEGGLVWGGLDKVRHITGR